MFVLDYYYSNKIVLSHLKASCTRLIGTKKDHCFSAVLSGTRIKTELRLLLSSTKH
jgi:hypothetical protein